MRRDSEVDSKRDSLLQEILRRDIRMGDTPEIVTCSKITTDWTLLGCSWIPSSPRVLALGSTLSGQGRLAVYSLSGQGLTEVGQGSTTKALRCGTFRGGRLEDRILATGDFTGRIQLWDLEEPG